MNDNVTPMSTNHYDHDMTWLELMRAADKADQRVESAGKTLLYADNWTQTDRGGFNWRKRSGGYSMYRFEAVKEARQALVDSHERIMSYGRSGADMVVEYDERRAERDAAVAMLAAHDERYTGWNRYFLVVSSSGLIHRSTSCSTCNKGHNSTLFALLPTLSGQSYGDAVALLGPSLCSVCFPEAPVAVVDGPKIPARVAEVLFALGPKAFTDALELHNAKQAAKAAKKGS